ncbi:MAG: 50S ribosomal protein L10 [Patescibacteria group bacterium]|nr:50S ribosomal protein L10 [Patescibacteria group bacterium]MCL5261935.1 50S ribosomal protein L10 [Patescibacteria group bacterium]
MLTRKEKQDILKQGAEDVKSSQALVFLDFTGVPTGKLNAFRSEMRKLGGHFDVVKKRLLKLIFSKANLAIDPEALEGQIGTVFSPTDIFTLAGPIYKAEGLKVVGGFDIAAGKAVPAADIVAMGKLPPREILLGQVVGTIAAPLTSLLYVLKERSKQTA